MRDSETILNEIKAIKSYGAKINYLQNEGGEGFDHTEDTYNLEKELSAAKKTEWVAEWSVDVTASRRTEWNALKVRGIKAMISAERDLGFSFSDLKKAIAHHNM